MAKPNIPQKSPYVLEGKQKKYALVSMCVGVGQGIAMVIERVS